MTEAQQDNLITLTIDGREVRVPKGTNIIEAAKSVEVEVPFYCYHPHLSVPGNCRMCQVEVEGAPKLMIGCHTQVTDGMVVKTHLTSQKVVDAQASTLEMLLINHPLDCTVCDQAGHCKLQDYHYEYNARPSRFLENKEKKVKAEPLGPTVILDGERCIACTRCVRFCDEITETGEIGLLNRGDKYVIAVNEDKELNNPLSGTVVDLCPVGALTHRTWRFNTRMWYTRKTETICPGCSTGCNAQVHTRDGGVVQVKARMNGEVNKEWMCDEGRYGFDRFLPQVRVDSPYLDGEPKELDELEESLKKMKTGKALILVSPELLLEEMEMVRALRESVLSGSDVALAYRERELTPVEAVLISPDYAANRNGYLFCGLGSDEEALQQEYAAAVNRIKAGEYDTVLFVGDRALAREDLSDLPLLNSIEKTPLTVGLLCDRESPLFAACNVVLPARSVLEKSGLLVNRTDRLQYSQSCLDFPDGTDPEWRLLGKIAKLLGRSIVEAESDRALTLSYLKAEPRLKGLTIRAIKGEGIDLERYEPVEDDTGDRSLSESRE